MTDPAPRRTWQDCFFRYSWSEAGAVRWLRDRWMGVSMGVGLLGLIFNPFDDALLSAMVLGSVASWPGYRWGLRLQAQLEPRTLVSESLMIWQFRNLSVVTSLGGLAWVVKLMLTR